MEWGFDMPTPINISASRGAAILGLSNWSTPLNIWLQIMESRDPGFCEKNNYKFPEFEYSAPMRWGHAFESAIIELASEKQGCSIMNREKLYGISFDKKYTEYNSASLSDLQLTCHIDGQFNSKLLHEGKTTSFFYWKDNFGEPGTDKVPVEYQIQCQHQMICTGAEKVILSVLVFPRRVEEWEEMGWEIRKNCNEVYHLHRENFNEKLDITEWAYCLDQMGYFYQYEIPANPELQALMIQHYTEFWNENVIKGIVPEPKTYDDIKSICREPVGTIVATEEIERFMSEYKNIKSELSSTSPLAKRADQIRVAVLDYMRKHGADAIDDDSSDKFVLRDRAGQKIGSYGKNKNGAFYFR